VADRLKRGRVGPSADCAAVYLPFLLSSVSGGRTTSPPSIGKALSSMLNPGPSLWGKAAPILVQRFPAFPLLSYSSTIVTVEHFQRWDPWWWYRDVPSTIIASVADDWEGFRLILTAGQCPETRVSVPGGALVLYRVYDETGLIGREIQGIQCGSGRRFQAVLHAHWRIRWL
jgi:hypothetical protein